MLSSLLLEHTAPFCPFSVLNLRAEGVEFPPRSKMSVCGDGWYYCVWVWVGKSSAYKLTY